MKVRHPFLIRLAGLVIAWVVRLWISTLRHRTRFIDRAVDPHRPAPGQRFIYAFWHETLLLPAAAYSSRRAAVLISQHADGEMIARASRHLGLAVVRGSTTRGGIEAMRQLMRLKDRADIVITPDGPRGPRRQVQPGLIYLAARTGTPIVPTGHGYQKAWRIPSWDRFAIPYPFAAAVTLVGEAIHVPAKVSREQLEQYRLRVEQELNRLTDLAEDLARRRGW
jgi:hypothetical protein